VRTGLAELIYLHPFGPFRFADMLLSPPGFPSRLAGYPRRCLCSQPPAPRGNLTCTEAAHHNNRYGIKTHSNTPSMSDMKDFLQLAIRVENYPNE